MKRRNNPQNPLCVKIGGERLVLTDGLQPFMLRSRRGALFLQAQFTAPTGFKRAVKDVIPGDGVCGNVISRDNGRTWKRWTPKAWEDRMPFFEGGWVELSDGAVLMFEFVAGVPDRRGDLRVNRWEIKDDFQTVRGPVQSVIHLPQAKRGGYDDGGRPYSGLTFHRTVLELPDGDLLASVYCWFKGDKTPCSYQPKMCKFRCVLLRSCDRGHHWDFVSTIAVDPKIGEEGFDEPVMIRLSKGPKAGRLICLMRTGGHDCFVYQSVSDDEGITLSKPRRLSFRGVDPDLIEMSDGTLACSFGWRTPNWAMPRPSPNLGNRLIFSRDQGDAWTHPVRLPIEPHANTRWTTCYTTVREIAPGKLFVVYDIGKWGAPVRYIAGREIMVGGGGL